jgi:hypothetical protein
MNIDISQIGYRWKGIYSEFLSYAENDVVYKDGGAYVIRNGAPAAFALGQQDATLKGHLLTGGVSAGGFGNMVLHSKGAGGVEFRFQDTKNGTLATQLMDARTGRLGQYLAASYYMTAVMHDGSCRTWGSQTMGRGGAGNSGDIGRTFPARVAFPPGTPPVTSIYNVWATTYYITADGGLWSSGEAASGMTGTNTGDHAIPKKLQGYGDIPSDAKFVKIRGAYGDNSYRQAMFLDDQGRVYCVGTNQYTSLGITGTSAFPRLIPFTESVPIKEMTMQGSLLGASALISREGELYVAGEYNTCGAGGGADVWPHRQWMPWGLDKPVKQVMMSETDAHWIAGYNNYRTQGVVLENGDLYVWGNQGGQFSCGWGVGYNADVWTGSALHPYKVLEGVKEYAAVQGGYPKLVALMDDGTVQATGDGNFSVVTPARNTWAQEGAGILKNGTRLTMYGSQYSASCGILTSDGTVVMWGHDDTGFHGVGDAPAGRPASSAKPVMLDKTIIDFQISGYAAVAQPYMTAHFLTSDGQVYSSGSGYYSVNGDDDSENTYVPRQILF